MKSDLFSTLLASLSYKLTKQLKEKQEGETVTSKKGSAVADVRIIGELAPKKTSYLVLACVRQSLLSSPPAYWFYRSQSRTSLLHCFRTCLTRPSSQMQRPQTPT